MDLNKQAELESCFKDHPVYQANLVIGTVFDFVPGKNAGVILTVNGLIV